MSKKTLKNRANLVQHAARNPFRFGVLRTVLASLLTVTLFVGSTAAFVYRSLANQVKDASLDISALEAPQSTKPEPMKLIDAYVGQPINILVSGVDSRYNQSSDYGDAEELTTIQSDTTMIAHISADRSEVTFVSIPRDLLTDIPSCMRSDGSITSSYYGMFNSAFAMGAGTNDLAGGVACTKATVEELTGLTIDGFIVVDFTGFKGLINAVGGVWLDIPEEMYDPASGLDLEAGCQYLDANSALAYARARKNVGDGSDISRIGRQQQLIAAALRELFSRNFVTDFPALISFVQAAIASLTVSPNFGDINADAGLFASMLKLQASNIRFTTMPWAEAPEDPNRVIEIEHLSRPLWQALAADTQLPGGTEYTDGTGAQMTIPYEDDTADSTQSVAHASSSSSGGVIEEQDVSDTAAVSDTASSASTDTAQSVPATCPPNR